MRQGPATTAVTAVEVPTTQFSAAVLFKTKLFVQEMIVKVPAEDDVVVVAEV
jgi:hypothetical protein